MSTGGEFKIVFDMMGTAMSDAQKTAAQIGDYFDGQVQQAMNINHFDEAHQQMSQSYQLRQKETGYWQEGLNSEGNAYGNVGDIGNQTLRQAINIVTNI
ncbi:hypothetical protein SAMN05216215_10383 [Saccharopolyspora shandongensis]|uniref:Uncharacterized protein n=1 Tax=Saccharopolyspora shandongensis TaxID=418495 RepID=A0A1H3NHU8_9PSEU|nr:hypothetical protein [Saccharopolyspora shandongensis]SDY88462.1 hypothetical protein SAMN05216215_10383 [Saccharopolyspora shandongensis]